jgi:hypothetical protein
VARFGSKLIGLAAATAVVALGYGNWLILNETIDTSGIAPLTPGVSLAAVEARTDKTKAVALADLTETLARPLFSPTRRPVVRQEQDEQKTAAIAPVADVAPPAPSEPKPTVRLIGMLHGVGKAQRALLQSEGGSSTNWVSVGSEFAGWRLTSIENDTVTVEASGARSVLTLHPASSPSHPVE